eukprot:4735877-Amphidinium_carterae.2
MSKQGASTFNIQDFTSHKFCRVAYSTSMAETAALVEGLSNLEWLIAWRKRQAIEKNVNDFQQHALAVVDSNSLYDVIGGTKIDRVKRRAGLESLLARDLLKSLKATIRWIPHEHNPSDSMTKISANHERLMSRLQTSTLHLRPETEILRVHGVPALELEWKAVLEVKGRAIGSSIRDCLISPKAVLPHYEMAPCK